MGSQGSAPTLIAQ